MYRWLIILILLKEEEVSKPDDRLAREILMMERTDDVNWTLHYIHYGKHI